MKAVKQTSIKRRYRGHPLVEASRGPVPSIAKSATGKPGKAKRIYRGQVIED